jgi:hypothetical protein
VDLDHHAFYRARSGLVRRERQSHEIAKHQQVIEVLLNHRLDYLWNKISTLLNGNIAKPYHPDQAISQRGILKIEVGAELISGIAARLPGPTEHARSDCRPSRSGIVVAGGSNTARSRSLLGQASPLAKLPNT